jgi:ribonuclease HI
MAKKKKYYAVAKGKKPGIYTEWYGDKGAEIQVKGFAGARFKGFPTLKEAEAFIKQISTGTQSPKPKPVRAKPKAGTRPRADARKAPGPKKGSIAIYTDGGCLNNPGPGGYGVVIQNGKKSKELSGGYRLTTNNRMELMACIVGLSEFETPVSVTLYSDSKYVVNGITKGWAKRWQKNGWMRTKTEAAVNPDLWERLLEQCDRHDVGLVWVKGHAGNQGNERCDTLATMEASKKHLPRDVTYEDIRRGTG